MAAPTEDWRRFVGHSWGVLVVRGVLALIMGVVALILPGITALALVLTIGVYAIVDGVVLIFGGGTSPALPTGAALRITTGVVSVLAGVVLIAWPVKSAEVLVIVAGVWAIIGGITGIALAIGLRRRAGSQWGWAVAAGLLSVLFGVLVLANVPAGLLSIVWIIGVYALLYGVTLIGFGAAVRRTTRRPA
jgi:uncharacterized membrane protein HdeD (DUF308 family)